MWQNHGPVWWQIWSSIIYSVFFSLLINFIWVLSLNSTELMFLWNILNIKISISIIYGAGIYIYNVFHITLATTEFHSLIYCLFIYSDKISLPSSLSALTISILKYFVINKLSHSPFPSHLHWTFTFTFTLTFTLNSRGPCTEPCRICMVTSFHYWPYKKKHLKFSIIFSKIIT